MPSSDIPAELWRWSCGPHLHHPSDWWRDGRLQRKCPGHFAWHDCLHRMHTGAVSSTGQLSSQRFPDRVNPSVIFCFDLLTNCVKASLSFYNPQINFPMCTIASMPRLPEHCIEYARILQWPKEKPFGGKMNSHLCHFVHAVHSDNLSGVLVQISA